MLLIPTESIDMCYIYALHIQFDPIVGKKFWSFSKFPLDFSVSIIFHSAFPYLKSIFISVHYHYDVVHINQFLSGRNDPPVEYKLLVYSERGWNPKCSIDHGSPPHFSPPSLPYPNCLVPFQCSLLGDSRWLHLVLHCGHLVTSFSSYSWDFPLTTQSSFGCLSYGLP